MKDSVHPEPSQQSAIPSLGSEASRSIPIPSNSIAIGRQQIRRADEDPVFLYHNKEAASPKADSPCLGKMEKACKQVLGYAHESFAERNTEE